MEKYLDKNSVLRLLQGIKTQIDKSKQNVLDTKGVANGIASLDENGNVPLSQLGNVDTDIHEIALELPTQLTEKQSKHIFLVPRGVDEKTNKNIYKEYIFTGSDITNVKDTDWEQLGEFTTSVDLKDYSKKSETISDIRFTDMDVDGSWTSNTILNNLLFEFADGKRKIISIPLASGPYYGTAHQSPGGPGFMSGEDKAKLDKIDLNALTASINAANTAADNTNKAIKAAEKVDAIITEENIFEVTDRTGAKKTLDLNITAEGSVDNAVGTPSVEINQSVENNKQKLSFNFKNIKGEKGDIGNKGDAFTYDDFTPEQLKTLQDKVVESSKEVAMVEVNKYTDLVKLPNIEVPVSGDTVTLEPNKVYNIAIGESLTLALTPPTDTTITNEYQGSFDTGATAPTVTFPADVKWAETPSVEANTHYEFNIRYIGGKYYGLVQEWNINT